MAEQEQNPFTMVLTALWDMLLEHPQFVRDVPERNRIRFDSLTDRDPLKDTVAAADMPEVAVVAETVTANIMESSSSSRCNRVYSVLVSTGDFRYSAILGQVEWAVFAALTGWKAKLAALRWNGEGFVKNVNVTTARSGLRQSEQDRNLTGWSAVWSIEVMMVFSTSDLLAELGCQSAQAN